MRWYSFPAYFKNKGSFTEPLAVLLSPVLMSIEQTPDETLRGSTVFTPSSLLAVFCGRLKSDNASLRSWNSWLQTTTWSSNVNKISSAVKPSVSTFIMSTCQSWTECRVDYFSLSSLCVKYNIWAELWVMLRDYGNKFMRRKNNVNLFVFHWAWWKTPGTWASLFAFRIIASQTKVHWSDANAKRWPDWRRGHTRSPLISNSELTIESCVLESSGKSSKLAGEINANSWVTNISHIKDA